MSHRAPNPTSPLGNAAADLTRLWAEENAAERARNQALSVALYDQIKATETLASYMQVETALDAITFLGLINDTASHLDGLVINASIGASGDRTVAPVQDTAETDAAEVAQAAIVRMTYSILRWIESTHGVNRVDAAGGIYMPAYRDLFAPATAQAEAA